MELVTIPTVDGRCCVIVMFVVLSKVTLPLPLGFSHNQVVSSTPVSPPPSCRQTHHCPVISHLNEMVGAQPDRTVLGEQSIQQHRVLR